jgi:hypothetical protein
MKVALDTWHHKDKTALWRNQGLFTGLEASVKGGQGVKDVVDKGTMV